MKRGGSGFRSPRKWAGLQVGSPKTEGEGWEGERVEKMGAGGRGVRD